MKTVTLVILNQYLNNEVELDKTSISTEDISDIIADIFFANLFIYLIFVGLVAVFWLLILRYFKNQSIDEKLERQNELLFEILSELKKGTAHSKEDASLDFGSETSLNDPKNLENLIDKLDKSEKE